MNISLPPTPLPLPISIVGARPANLDQSRQKGACFWCRAVCGGVQEGARASSRHTVWAPRSASWFAAKARVCVLGENLGVISNSSFCHIHSIPRIQ